MKEPLCDDKLLLMSYLYGECDEAERRLVDEHLAGCVRCAAEIEALRDVRITLREWAPPDRALGFRVVRDAELPRQTAPAIARVLGWTQAGGRLRVPAWAQAVAAVLVLAVAAAIANFDVRFGAGGVTIRTGWQKTPAAQAPLPVSAQRAPWRADLAALERRLRSDLSPVTSASLASSPSMPAPTTRVSREETAAILQRVQALIDDSERRQQRALEQQMAERFLRLSRDVSAQRFSDLRNIQQGLGQMDLRTNELRQVQNYLLRIANVQEIK